MYIRLMRWGWLPVAYSSAMFEQFQQADGKIKVPDVLKPWIKKDYIV